MLISAKNFIGLRVETKSGQYLGRVKNFALETDSLDVQNISVRPVGIVKRFVADELTVSKTAIIAIDDKKITVRDFVGEELARAKETKPEPVMDSQPTLASEM
jgi:sporulation protein YlmC with PRC-barrel domain